MKYIVGARIAQLVLWVGYRLGDRGIWAQLLIAARDFLISAAYRPALEPTQLLSSATRLKVAGVWSWLLISINYLRMPGAVPPLNITGGIMNKKGTGWMIFSFLVLCSLPRNQFLLMECVVFLTSATQITGWHLPSFSCIVSGLVTDWSALRTGHWPV